ncbi:MAG: LuxR C-terminal-related transcriptional regulator [Pseudomonadota bacterium]
MNSARANQDRDMATSCIDCLDLPIIDSLASQIAILDENGVILKTNESWKRSAVDSAIPCAFAGIGDNYLNICRLDQGDGNRHAQAIARGINQVIRQETDQFRLEYEFHTPRGIQWYYIRVVCLALPGPLRLIVTHDDITDLKKVEHTLLAREEELRARTVSLEEKNITLKVLLEHRDNDRSELETLVLKNVRHQILPFVEKLKSSSLKPSEKRLVEIIAQHLNELTSPMITSLSNANVLLTPQEIQVASLVKDGKSSQEIANLLFLSEATVHFHRKNIRNKLGIQNKKVNLRSHLMTLA